MKRYSNPLTSASRASRAEHFPFIESTLEKLLGREPTIMRDVLAVAAK